MDFEFTLTGASALLMHHDDVQWADVVSAWRLDPDNSKKKGEASGDDRRPAWGWIGYLYRSPKTGNVAMPSANLASCLKKAGARVPLGARKTFKELAVSGILFADEFLKFTNNGREVSALEIDKLRDVPEFASHAKTADKMGFKLFVKRAPVGMSKHVRVRPRFDQWAVSGVLTTTAHEITPTVLQSIFDQAGRVGLGDWRPGSPKSPGPYGMFSARIKPCK